MSLSYMAIPGIIANDPMTIICEYFKTSKSDLISSTRVREIADARHIAMYAFRKTSTMTATAIGKIFKRDHATVIHACRKVENMKSYDAEFANKVKELEKIIKYSFISVREA